MQLLPAIDIRDGKCVRLKQGDYAQETIYGAYPADMAHRWVSDGATALHIVDLDGARSGSTTNRRAIVKIVNEVEVDCQLGGGIRDEQTIVDYLEMGLDRLVIGTKALTDPGWLAEMTAKYPWRLMVGIDARDGHAAMQGWLKTSDVVATELAGQMSIHPIAGIIYTDITKDGMMCGPNFAAMSQMKQSTTVSLFASGGIASVDDVKKLNDSGIDGCIIGRALYEGRLTLADAMAAISQSTPNTS